MELIISRLTKYTLNICSYTIIQLCIFRVNIIGKFNTYPHEKYRKIKEK